MTARLFSLDHTPQQSTQVRQAHDERRRHEGADGRFQAKVEERGQTYAEPKEEREERSFDRWCPHARDEPGQKGNDDEYRYAVLDIQ